MSDTFQMLRIRMIEEEISKRYPEGKMRCPVHLSIGQEGPAVGICSAIGPEDRMVSTHRGHAHYLAKGGSLKGLIAELHGKDTGCSRGNGGSMHLVDLSKNFCGSTSIVGGTIPVGVGLAFADKMKGDDNYTVICFGDAAVEEGVFHEAANFASLYHLNVLFFCENNGFSCYTPLHERQPDRPLIMLARAHDLRYGTSGANPRLVRRNAQFLMRRPRGPAFLEVETERDFEHCGPAREQTSKPIPEEPGWREKIQAEINEAFVFAEESPPAQLVSMYAD